MSAPFVHLHCHSHYSLLDGASPIPKLVKRAKSLGMNALALTDHGNLHGALEFYNTCRKEGINPILGYEAYISPGSRFQKDAGTLKEASYHLTLLAQNRVGFKNLIKMASAAYLEGFYFKPRIDKELLAAHSEGIICLSGCVSSEFSKLVMRGGQPSQQDYTEAQAVAAWFQKLFGERYFVEIQNNGLDIQRMQMEGAVEVARRMGLPLVATSDAHYVNQEDAVAQDVLLCINTGKFRTDTNRMRMEGDQFYLRGPAEMYAHFPGLEEAVKQSQLIADTVQIDLELGKRHFPVYTPPDEKTPGEFLRALCEQGCRERYADHPHRWEGEKAPGVDHANPAYQLSAEVRDRLDRELDVIEKLGFPNYFLIVWDFVNYARQQGIPATARGSGVGAIVSYSLYLSHVCPLEYDLLFERFLDLNRKEAPDIDIDFCQDRRQLVIDYVKSKYGSANVAQIGTFGTLAARAAIRDVGRALGMPIPEVDKIVAMVPEELGIELGEALTKSADLRAAYERDPQIHELLDLAQKIEGLARNVGTHAAAVVIADRPLDEYVPLCRVKDKAEVITQWSMGDVETAGLLKMDFLGLRNLTILSRAVELIEQTTGKKIDPHKFPLDDKQTFALLCRGETKGIFQLESGGIRDLLQKMKPDHFRDIIATNALYRPGPLEGGMVEDYVKVKHGQQKAEYIHPICEKILSETHGVMVYQEQVMRILNELGGIELAAAYTCIKAISKKKEDTIAKNREQFVAGAQANGVSKAQAQDFWNLIIKFAGYGFNKSHSTAYALIAYMTAYLKAHYPIEFMAALLCGDISSRNFKTKDKLVEHLEDCRRLNVTVLPPNVNTSNVEFGVLGGQITFGLSAIKGCGGQASEAIVAERHKRGPFKDLFDFCERVDPGACSRATLEALIKAGAFDSLGARRSQYMAVLDRAIQTGAAAAADRKVGQLGLFGDDPDEGPAAQPLHLPDLPEWDDKQRLMCEKEVLGFYLSSHPLAAYAETLSAYCSHTTAAIPQLESRTEVLLGGMLGSIKFSQTKNPRAGETNTKYAMFDLEDVDGLVRCILWPSEFVNFGHMVQPEAILAVRGSLERRVGSDEANIIVNELIPLDELATRMTRGVRIRLLEDQHGPKKLQSLYEILRGYPGTSEVELSLWLADGARVHLRSEQVRILWNNELKQRLEDLLGPGNYRLLASQPKSQPAPSRNGRNGNGYGNGQPRGAGGYGRR
ncbi:MAG: DNA polymerase III subunit alpha [Pirellulales bacterium]|nr:DNA polymerase III subunit alpha [Pirellulales bacterium]